MKRRAFKIGDIVRVDTPLHVVRVGYPKCVADYEEPAKALLPSLHRWVRENGINTIEDRILPLWVPLAKLMLRQDGFGGDKREIHTEPREHWAGREGIVVKTRRCMTGTYEAGYMSGYEEPEYNPPFLGDAKSHALLTVLRDLGGSWFADGIEVEACHATFIREATADEREAARS